MSRDAFFPGGARQEEPFASIGPPFSLDLYREMVHDGLRTPGVLGLNRTWETPPHFYIVTTHEDGSTMPRREISRVEAIIRHVTPQWTGGTFSAIVTAGDIDPGAPPDTIVIRFLSDGPDVPNGRATIGANPGRIRLQYPSSVGCRAQRSRIRSSLIAHEVGHALGFSHHNSEGLLGRDRWRACHAAPDLSDAELFHARLAYTRPRGERLPQ